MRHVIKELTLLIAQRPRHNRHPDFVSVFEGFSMQELHPMKRFDHIPRIPARRRLRSVTAALAVALAALAPTATRAEAPTNVVYVMTNVSNPSIGNAVLAYTRGADGALTLLGTFPTGGIGAGPSFAFGNNASDRNLVLDAGSSMLFAVNGGSDSVALFRVNRDGSLTTIPGSPVSSLGTDPTSVAVSGSTLLVADTAQDPNRPELTQPDYASLSLRRSDELLSGIPRSVIATDIGSTPSQILFSPDGKVAFGNNFVGGTLLSFAVSENGRLTQTGEQAPPEGLFEPSGAAPDPLGLAVHPSARILYVGLPFISQLGVYRYNDRGRLTFVGSVANSGAANCWLVTNNSGDRLYTANTGDRSVSVFDISIAERPVQIQNVVLTGTGGLFQIDIDGSSTYFYALTQRNDASVPFTANALHVLQVSRNGTLTEVATSPTVLPVPQDGTRPLGVLAP
jgi:Lactonase, 7-bladed beta-propeller